MPQDAPPATKLVIARGEQPWTGSVYPTQAGKGPKQTFTTGEELLAAVARLAQWDQPTDGPGPPLAARAGAPLRTAAPSGP